MKSRVVIIGIFLSVFLVCTAAILYWMAVQTRAGDHRLALSTVQRMQQLESQWSVEAARVRSNPLADFDSLTQFIPRIDQLKRTLSEAVKNTPSLPDRLVNTTNAYLSSITAKEERIERFKTGYAVLRNSVRYLPLAASNVMQQMQIRGADSAFVRNVATVTDDITTYLASPAPPEKERLARMLTDLGDRIATRHPALINTAMNFVAHGQVLLDKQAPTEEIFQEATSDRIGVLGQALIEGLESEINALETSASNYENGILASGGALWLMWLAIALRLPKEDQQQDNRRSPRFVLDRIAAPRDARSAQDGGRGQRPREGEAEQPAAPKSATDTAARRIWLEAIAKQLTSLAERINGNAATLNDLFGDRPGVGNGTPPDDALQTATAAVDSIRAQANGIAACAAHLPSLSRKQHDVQAWVNINDSIDEVVDDTQVKTKARVVTDLSPVPDMFASGTEIYLILASLIENSMWAVEGHGRKRGVIRIETREEDDGVVVTIADNGLGIRDEEHQQVFNPFYTSKDNAAGMGLTSAQYLVEKYGGSVLLDSMPNQGTTVQITLPVPAAGGEA